MTTESEIQILIEALLGQWSHFGRESVGGLEDDGEFVWTEAPFAHLPYNAVLRTQAEDRAVDRIRCQLKRFELRKVHFLWVVNPLDKPRNLEDILINEGLSLITREIGMACEIAEEDEGLSWQHRGITYRPAENAREIRDFEALTMEYWGLPEEMQEYVQNFTRRAFVQGICGFFFIAYQGSKPVGKAYLSTIGRPGTSSLWAVFVRPQARGLGIGSHLTRLALAQAAKIGRNKVVLLSTEMGRAVYRRYRFHEVCEFPVYADTPTVTTLQGLQPRQA